MYFSPPGCFRRVIGAWERLDAPTLTPRFRNVGPALAAGPRPADERQPYKGSKPLQLSPGFRRLSSGFTLLELLVVLGVVALLSGIVLGVGRYAAEKGKAARARAELSALSAALESYKLAWGDHPRTNLPDHLLQALIGRRGPENQAANGPSLIEPARFSTAVSRDPFSDPAAVLLDPWEQPYRYAFKSQASWTNPSFVLWSAGPDGKDTPTLLSGGFPDTAAPGNADNLYANQP